MVFHQFKMVVQWIKHQVFPILMVEIFFPKIQQDADPRKIPDNAVFGSIWLDCVVSESH